MEFLNKYCIGQKFCAILPLANKNIFFSFKYNIVPCNKHAKTFKIRWDGLKYYFIIENNIVLL